MRRKIYIYDEISAPAAHVADLRAAYLERYAPEARRRGMVLEGAWRSPPIDVPGRDATLHVMWSMPDAQAWWAMRLADVEAKSLWWEYVDSLATARKRTVMTDLIDEGSDV